MRLEVLGCYGNSFGKFRSTAFLINGEILLDAGTTSEVLDNDRLKSIKSVIISHTHVDHIRGLFPLLDEIGSTGKNWIRIYGVGPVIEILLKNVFNDLVWPDFTKIPSPDEPILRPLSIDLEKETKINGISFTPIPVDHTVFTTGFIVREGSNAFGFTSDTRKTRRFWEVVRQEEGLKFVIADVSFPERKRDLAEVSGHMTLSMLIESLDFFGITDIPILIYHIKPFFLDEVKEEVKRSGRANLRILDQGEEIIL